MRKKGTVPRVCERCGTHFVVWPSKVAAGHGRFCSPECRYLGLKRKSGPEHVQWKGGRGIGAGGYVLVRVTPNTSVYEHRHVWEQAHGPIPPGAHIHHRNGVKTDNRLENLELFLNGEHQRQHRLRREAAGRWALKWAACQGCGGTDRPHAARGYCRPCYYEHVIRP